MKLDLHFQKDLHCPFEMPKSQTKAGRKKLSIDKEFKDRHKRAW